eukprot:g2648.t1
MRSDVSESLTTFLEALPARKLRGLYDNQWTCQAVFRSLPPLAKQYCLRLLFVDEPVSQTIVDGWVKQESSHKHTETVEKLIQLQLFQRVSSSYTYLINRKACTFICRTSDVKLILQKDFRNNVRLSVLGRGAMHDDLPEEVLPFVPDQDELLKFANAQWEGLLLYLIGATSHPPEKSVLLDGKDVAFDRLLESAGLAEIQESGNLSITTEGFRFLLLDQGAQLWRLMSQYIIAAESEMGTDLERLFSFLLELGFRPSNKPGQINALDQVQYNIATHMEQFGIIAVFKTLSNEVCYVPTPLAVCFCTNPNTSTTSIHDNSSVVIETNFKLYGYTESALVRQILELFSRCDCMLPNLYVGTITRESISDALDCGINSEQIIHYLQSHVHHRIQQRTPILPDNVPNQIRLWEQDINRVKTQDAILLEYFPSEEAFNRALQHSKKQEVYLWDDGKAKLIIKLQGGEEMKEFIKTLK